MGWRVCQSLPHCPRITGSSLFRARGYLASRCGHSCPLTWSLRSFPGFASLSTSTRKCPCARSTPSDERGHSILYLNPALHPLLECGVSGFSHFTGSIASRHLTPLPAPAISFHFSSVLPSHSRARAPSRCRSFPRSREPLNLPLCLAASCAERIMCLKGKNKAFRIGRIPSLN